ncbi:hypothetical protein KO317_02100 [Candidatus Micrarchaeota archaeon]|nr:hypothetical protein [Candidatus Micrarchaeota archaeon]
MIPIELQTQGLLLTFVLSLIMLGIYVLIHLFSFILQDESLRAKAKTEYGQVILNLFFFFLIVVVAIPIIDNEIIPKGIVQLDPYSSIDTTPNIDLILSNTLTMQEAGVALNPDGKCLYTKKGFEVVGRNYAPHICVTLSFLDRTEWLISETMTQMLLLYQQLSFFSSFKFLLQGYVIAPKPPFLLLPEILKIMPGVGYSVEFGMYAKAFKLLSHSLIINIIQKNAVDIVAQVLFPVLLISGFVFRSFEFTRKLGGFLIATSLSLYYIAPLPYIIGHRAMFESGNFIGLQTSLTGQKLLPYADFMTEGSASLLPQFDFENAHFDFLHPLESLKNIGKGFTEYYNRVFSISDAYLLMHLKGQNMALEIDGILHMIGKIAMLTVIIPLLVLFAILASIKTMAPFFGGDASIAGLSHFL